jgi:signal transduction histidine kinase
VLIRWIEKLRGLSLRSKLAITLAGGAVILLGAATFFSFRTWRGEAIASVRAQSRVVAVSSASALEPALAFGQRDQARRQLRQLVSSPSVVAARVYDRTGLVLLSSDPVEEGRRRPGVWIPRAAELPAQGLDREIEDGRGLSVFLPLDTPAGAVYEIDFSVGPFIEALDRGATFGIGLLLASTLALGLILLAMLEREVVAPIRRVEGMLGQAPGENGAGERGEIRALESSVARLIAAEEAAERRAEAQDRALAEKENLAQVGEMAAEMAHEFKRPLASIRTALEMLQAEYELDPQGQQVLEAVNTQLDHLTGTMKDLFALARPMGLEQPASVRVSELLDAALFALTGYPGMESIDVIRDYAADLPVIRGDARRLEHAFQNLMANAIEAMAAGGTLTLRARRSADGGVDVDVCDTGAGMPEETVEYALKPFYSTKPHGTGLGLPLVMRVVSSHKGSLRIESKPGSGTTVHVHLLPDGGRA